MMRMAMPLSVFTSIMGGSLSWNASCYSSPVRATHHKRGTLTGEEQMDSKLYLTVAAIVAIIYGLGFVLIPGHLVAFYGMTPEPHLVLNIRFFGTTLIALGVIFWFARDVREWAAVRGVLIGAIVGDALG